MPDRVLTDYLRFDSFRPRACVRVALSAHHFSLLLSLRFPVRLYCTPPRTRAHAHREAHTHTSVSPDIFQLFHPILLYLHALSLSKVTTFVFMSYPLRVCVWHMVTYSLYLSPPPTHTHTNIYPCPLDPELNYQSP